VTTIYLSGPMTGLPDFNYPAFNTEAARLRGMGFSVINPAEAPECDSWVAYMRNDLVHLLKWADALVYLPGWENSKGAGIEIYVAHALGLPVVGSDNSLGILELLDDASPVEDAAAPARPRVATEVPLLSIPMRDDSKDLNAVAGRKA
jgi:glycosyltransferase involved in cell wall biosynthesis